MFFSLLHIVQHTSTRSSVLYVLKRRQFKSQQQRGSSSGRFDSAGGLDAYRKRNGRKDTDVMHSYQRPVTYVHDEEGSGSL